MASRSQGIAPKDRERLFAGFIHGFLYELGEPSFAVSASFFPPFEPDTVETPRRSNSQGRQIEESFERHLSSRFKTFKIAHEASRPSTSPPSKWRCTVCLLTVRTVLTSVKGAQGRSDSPCCHQHLRLPSLTLLPSGWVQISAYAYSASNGPLLVLVMTIMGEAACEKDIELLSSKFERPLRQSV